MRKVLLSIGAMFLVGFWACGGGGPAPTGGGSGSAGGGSAATGGGSSTTGGGDGATGGGDGTGGGSAVDAGDTPPEVVFTTSPVSNLPSGAKYALVSYGADPQQVMDVFLPEASAPTAAIIFFHGGGFTGGSRTSGYSGVVPALNAGLANPYAGL